MIIYIARRVPRPRPCAQAKRERPGYLRADHLITLFHLTRTLYACARHLVVQFGMNGKSRWVLRVPPQLKLVAAPACDRSSHSAGERHGFQPAMKCFHLTSRFALALRSPPCGPVVDGPHGIRTEQTLRRAAPAPRWSRCSYREQCQALAWLQDPRILASCSCSIMSSSPSV